MQKNLKYLRIVWALLFLVAVTFLFVDFSETFPEPFYQWILSLQVVPGVMRLGQFLMHGAGVTAWGLVTVLVLTLLFGRVYCSFLCPLGMLQDVAGTISRRFRGKKGRLKFALPQNRWRYAILGLVVVSVFFAGTLLLNLTDPYSNFGRIASDLIRPVYLTGNNLLASGLQALGSYWLYPVEIIRAEPLTLLVPVLVLGLVVWMSVRRGRLFCNTVCPVGTLLGLISRGSLFRLSFNKKTCNRCGDCMYACKSQCIDVKTQTVDVSRCVGCFNCITACDKGGIRYRPAFSGRASKAEATVSSGRRKMLAETAGFLAVAAGSVSLLKAQDAEGSGAEPISFDGAVPEDQLPGLRRVPVSPPGSRGLAHFTSACTACHLCVSACPTGVLQPSFLDYGLLGINMPRMDYMASFCNEYCTKCSEVCPNGAILPLTTEEKSTVQLGRCIFTGSIVSW